MQVAPDLEEQTISCYGLKVQVFDATGSGLCPRVFALLPPEFGIAVRTGAPLISYRIQRESTAGSGYSVLRNNLEAFQGVTEEEISAWIRQDIDMAMARHSHEYLFVHAGVVGWRGRAILVVGRTFTGKSELVAELVRRGATYYSDEFAVLDQTGRVHSYARPLVLRDPRNAEPRDLRLYREDTPRPPLPIGLIVAAPYRSGTAWRPTVLRGTRAVLRLIDGTVLAREECDAILRIAARVAPTTVALEGPRPEAADVAPRILDLIDDFLVSQSLAASEKAPADAAANLAAVAGVRLRGSIAPPPPHRELLTARHLRITEFLSPEEHRRVVEHVFAREDAFQESGIVGKQGEDLKEYGVRKSRTLAGFHLDGVWEVFERRLRGMLPHLRKELGLSWFPPGETERQVTAHASGGFFVPHVDNGHAVCANRRISCVYYFHTNPRRFKGGELKLYDSWATKSKTTAAPTYTTLIPLDNSIVFFRSDCFHEVCPVERDTEEFRDSRFAVTIWFREGAWPAWVSGGAANSSS